MSQEEIKYFLYARKSTEEAERQVMSIQAQIDEAKRRFPDLRIVETLTESASAFKPNNRPVFKEMMSRIEEGEAEGIISWHPDRPSNTTGFLSVLFSLSNGSAAKSWVNQANGAGY